MYRPRSVKRMRRNPRLLETSREWISSYLYPDFKSVALLFTNGFTFLSFIVEIEVIREKTNFIMTSAVEKFEVYVKKIIKSFHDSSSLIMYLLL